MAKSRSLLPFDEALRLVRRHRVRVGAESVGLYWASGRTLAGAVRAPYQLPAFDNSQMDGYAVAARDLEPASAAHPVELREIDRSYAGSPASSRLLPGTTIRVMTGAALPAGADAVVMQEDVEAKDGQVRFRAPADVGDYVRPAGADIRLGAQALAAGRRIGASEIGLLAALGIESIRVRKRPVVAILSTGDEIVPLGSTNRGKTIDSNRHALTSRLEAMGCDVRILGIAADRPSALRPKLKAALQADVALTIAGASVGDRDLVKPILSELGARFRFQQVAMRPGKPVGFAIRDTTLVFTLPGNPVSARVTFELLVAPALEALLDQAPRRPRWFAKLTKAVAAPRGLTYFPRVRLISRSTSVWAEPLGKQSSGFHTTLTDADALALIPPSGREVRRGALVEVFPL